MTADEKGEAGLAEELAADFAALEAWWIEAGVPTGFVDEPRPWLNPTNVEPAVAAAAEGVAPPGTGAPGRLPANDRPTFGGDPGRWPQSLEQFAEWWLSEPSLGLAGGSRRVPPRGSGGAELMVLVPQPEAEDEQLLLSGREGKLLTAILAALGLSSEQTYLASVLPAHVGLIDWAMVQERGMSALLSHHVRLAAPRRMLVLGREGIPNLLGHDLTDFGLASAHFEDPVLGLRVAYAPELAGLLERRSRKQAVWRLLLDWGD